MAQTTLYLIPDLYGTDMLYIPPGGGARRVWLDLYQLSQSGLPDELLWPVPQLGGAINTGSMVTIRGYGQLTVREWLEQNLPADWRIVSWTYDWRRGVLDLSQALAATITVGPPDAGGIRLLGLGYGGLVACAAYGRLVDAGQAARVPRVVTVGSPLAGSYAVCDTWRILPNKLNTLGNWQPDVFSAAGIGDAPLERYAREGRIFASWPSTYDLLPDPSAWDDPGDTLRPLAWQATNWANAIAPPSADGMASAQAFRAFMNAPGHWPPPGVLVCAVGWNRETGKRMAPANPNGADLARQLTGFSLANPFGAMRKQRIILAARVQLPGVATGQDGDGVASVAAQMRPGVQFVMESADHGELISHPNVRDNLAAMLTGSGLPGGPLDVTQRPDWPTYRPVHHWTDLPRPQRSIGGNVPKLPKR